MDAIDPVPVYLEQRLVSASLNGQILQNFTTGIYTVVYAWTMFLHMSRKGRNKWVVGSTISVLYLLYILCWIIRLYSMAQEIPVGGGTQAWSMFVFMIESLVGEPPALVALNELALYFGFAVADALLIWRCYHVWGKSLLVIFVPLAFLLAETGLIVCYIVLAILFGSMFGSSIGKLINALISAIVLVSFATTVITTFLIGYRIHAITHQNSTISKNRFRYIVVMTVESAVVASINLLVYAIFHVVPSFTNGRSPEFAGSYYDLALVNAISGMVPTILMVRLAVKSPDGDTISAPTFISLPDIPDVHSGSTPDAGENSNHEERTNGEPRSIIEIQEISWESVHGANMEGNSRGSTSSKRGLWEV